MAIPEGYTFLAKLGIAYKGDYSEAETYEKFNAVYYNGSTFIALVDNPDGQPIADGVNWQYMAQGFLSQLISSLTATDKNGVIGEAGKTVNAQELIDGISDDLKDKLDKDGDASNTTATFEQAENRTNIISGEKESTFRSKIKKWFADMTAAAFAQIISSNTDLMANTVSGYLVDALAVKQQFDVVNSNLDNKINFGHISTGGNLTANTQREFSVSYIGDILFFYINYNVVLYTLVSMSNIRGRCTNGVITLDYTHDSKNGIMTITSNVNCTLSGIYSLLQ